MLFFINKTLREKICRLQLETTQKFQRDHQIIMKKRQKKRIKKLRKMMRVGSKHFQLQKKL